MSQSKSKSKIQNRKELEELLLEERHDKVFFFFDGSWVNLTEGTNPREEGVHVLSRASFYNTNEYMIAVTLDGIEDLL